MPPVIRFITNAHMGRSRKLSSPRHICRIALLKLQSVLREVRTGEFIQIERVLRGEPVSIVALRYTGDAGQFSRKMIDLLDDACGALEPGQSIRISISAT